MRTERIAEVERITGETSIFARVNLDGTGQCDIKTHIGFLDHLFSSMSRHGSLDLQLTCKGDLDIDDHHTAEDCGLAVGEAIDKALLDRRGISRFGYAYAPLDEALARAVIDLSGRPFAMIELGLNRETIGQIACENITHVLVSMAMRLKASLHVDVLRGENDHHRAEAAFKAVGLALGVAIAQTGRYDVPSTKGVL